MSDVFSSNEKIRVLVAEDEVLVSMMVTGMLREMGFQVAGEARNGEEVTRLNHELRPDVILMDIRMPGMDGLEAARRIQQEAPAPVVILTSHDEKDLLVQAGEAGVGAYLIKPPDQREMERGILIAMARFQDLQELRRLNRELRAAVDNIKTLKGLLPICSHCKKVRDDEGYWEEVDEYVRRNTDAEFSHGLCPECYEKHYEEWMD